VPRTNRMRRIMVPAATNIQRWQRKKHKEKKEQMRKKREKVKQLEHGPDHCIHCDEDPCVFIQIEMCLCENDDIYYDRDDYEKGAVAYNINRHKRAYQ
jgi:hypothetical protein